MRKILFYVLLLSLMPLTVNAKACKLGVNCSGDSSAAASGTDSQAAHGAKCPTDPCKRKNCGSKGYCVVTGECSAKCVECKNNSDCSTGKKCDATTNQCTACFDGEICPTCSDPEQNIWHGGKCTKPACDIDGCDLCDANSTANCKTCKSNYYRHQYKSGAYDCYSCKGKYNIANGECSECDENSCKNVKCDEGYVQSYDASEGPKCVKVANACAATTCRLGMSKKSYNDGKKCCCEFDLSQQAIEGGSVVPNGGTTGGTGGGGGGVHQMHVDQIDDRISDDAILDRTNLQFR
ncbi:MAG: hypothetical protein MJ247_05315 [Alphaproteobacteria bacterium]|nr:hypothetical protein [Alphaproteobacteria bacterium]